MKLSTFSDMATIKIAAESNSSFCFDCGFYKNGKEYDQLVIRFLFVDEKLCNKIEEHVDTLYGNFSFNVICQKLS